VTLARPGSPNGDLIVWSGLSLIVIVARRLWRGAAPWMEQAIDEAIMAWCMEQERAAVAARYDPIWRVGI